MEEKYFNFTFEQLVETIKAYYDEEEYKINTTYRAWYDYQTIVITRQIKPLIHDITCYFKGNKIVEIGLLNDSITLNACNYDNMSTQQIALLITEITNFMENLINEGL